MRWIGSYHNFFHKRIGKKNEVGQSFPTSLRKGNFYKHKF